MARPKKLFKKFHSGVFVEGVKVTEENIEELENAVGGLLETVPDGGEHTEKVLHVPTLSGIVDVRVGQYVFYGDDNRIQVLHEDEFEQYFVVPKGKRQTEAQEAYDRDHAEDVDNSLGRV